MSASRSTNGRPAASRRVIADSKARVFGKPVSRVAFGENAELREHRPVARANQPISPPIVTYVTRAGDVPDAGTSPDWMCGFISDPCA